MDMSALLQQLEDLGLLRLAQLTRAAAGVHAGATRVVLAGTDAAMLDRALRTCVAAVPELTWHTHHADLDASEAPFDVLLPCHVLVWLTPTTAPLGVRERTLLDQWRSAPLPRRFLVPGDLQLLERLSDDPDAERAGVMARLAQLAPPGWEVTTLDVAHTRLLEHAEDWQHERIDTAQRWLRERITREVQRRLDALDSETAAQHAEARAEQARIDAVRDDATRATRRWLGVTRRHTEHVLMDLRGFFETLREDLPAQITAVADRSAARRALPGWLDHVVGTWLHDRLSVANAAVIEELRETTLGEQALAQVMWLPPMLAADAVPDQQDPRARIGANTTVAGGVALALAGLWGPGLLALVGGLSWASSLQQADRHPDPDRLLRHARKALRQLASEIEDALLHQRTHLERLLEELATADVHVLLAAQAEAETRRAAAQAGVSREARPLRALLARVTGPTESETARGTTL